MIRKIIFYINLLYPYKNRFHSDLKISSTPVLFIIQNWFAAFTPLSNLPKVSSRSQVRSSSNGHQLVDLQHQPRNCGCSEVLQLSWRGPSLSNGDPKTLEHRRRRFDHRIPANPLLKYLYRRIVSCRTFAIPFHDRSIDPRICLMEIHNHKPDSNVNVLHASCRSFRLTGRSKHLWIFKRCTTNVVQGFHGLFHNRSIPYSLPLVETRARSN